MTKSGHKKWRLIIKKSFSCFACRRGRSEHLIYIHFCDVLWMLVVCCYFLFFVCVPTCYSVEPRLVGHSRSIITQPGSSLSLPCRILGLENLNTGTSSTGSASILPLDAAVSWTLNGRRVGFDGNVYMKPGHSSLSFFGVKREMMGNYTCQLKYISSTRGTHSKSTSKRVINGMDHSSVSFPSSSSSSTFPAQLSSLQHKTQLTYSLIVRGIDSLFALFWRVFFIIDIQFHIPCPSHKNRCFSTETCGHATHCTFIPLHYSRSNCLTISHSASIFILCLWSLVFSTTKIIHLRNECPWIHPWCIGIGTTLRYGYPLEEKEAVK